MRVSELRVLSGLWQEYGAVLTLPIRGEKAPMNFVFLLRVKRGQHLCSRIYEHEKLNSKIPLHLLKICHASDAFTIQCLLSLQTSPKADTGMSLVYRGEHGNSKSHTSYPKLHCDQGSNSGFTPVILSESPAYFSSSQRSTTTYVLIANLKPR